MINLIKKDLYRLKSSIAYKIYLYLFGMITFIHCMDTFGLVTDGLYSTTDINAYTMFRYSYVFLNIMSIIFTFIISSLFPGKSRNSEFINLVVIGHKRLNLIISNLILNIFALAPVMLTPVIYIAIGLFKGGLGYPTISGFIFYVLSQMLYLFLINTWFLSIINALVFAFKQVSPNSSKSMSFKQLFGRFMPNFGFTLIGFFIGFFIIRFLLRDDKNVFHFIFKILSGYTSVLFFLIIMSLTLVITFVSTGISYSFFKREDIK